MKEAWAPFVDEDGDETKWPGHRVFKADETWPWTPERWRSPMYMPRWASRITLELTDVRVQRLQELSEADAKAEGVEQMEECPGSWTYAYAHVWDSIQAKRRPKGLFRQPRQYFWASNPWVFALTFRRVEPK